MIEREDDKAYAISILRDAMDVASEFNLDGTAWSTLFSKAVDIVVERRRNGRDTGIDTGDSTPPKATGLMVIEPKATDSLLDRVATRLRLERSIVADVFDDSEGTIDVIVAPRKLDPAKARATKQLALLVVAARQAADLEEWTDLDEIRRLADDFKKYDSANFASSIKEMQDDFRFKQVGRKITVKLGRPGWERAAEMVRRLAGED